MLRWKNLLSTGNEFIKFALDKNDMTLLVGTNGAGKSQFLDALCFVLFKRPFREINLPQLINSINKKDLVVEIAFTKGSDSFVVRRGLKPAVFEIYKNQQLIKQDAATDDYQNFLEKEILGFSYKSFVQIAVVGKATYVPFMSLKPQPRREFIEDLLDTHVYGKMLLIAKSDFKETNTCISNIKNQTTIVENNINAQKRLELLREEDKSNALSIKQDAVESIKERILDLQGQIDKFQFKIDDLKQQEVAIADYDKVIDAKGKIDAEVSKFQALVDSTKRRLKGLDGDICPSCKQKIDANHVAHIQEGVDTEVAEYETQAEVFKERNKKLHLVLEQITILRAQRLPIESSLNNMKGQIEVEKNALQRIYDEIKTIETKKPDEDLFNLDQLNQELESLTKQYDEWSEMQETTKKAIKYLGDDGIKAQLISKYIPIINQLVNKYLEAMNLFVQFDLDEQFNEVIRARYKDNYSFESFSEGEKLRINLALLLTWRYIAKLRNSVSTNIMVYDEVLDGSFDADGVLDFMKLLGDSETQNAVIISHNPDVKDLGFDNVIRAEKIGHFTEYNKV